MLETSHTPPALVVNDAILLCNQPDHQPQNAHAHALEVATNVTDVQLFGGSGRQIEVELEIVQSAVAPLLELAMMLIVAAVIVLPALYFGASYWLESQPHSSLDFEVCSRFFLLLCQFENSC